MCMWFYWYLKWPPQINFLNICDRKTSNLINGGGWYRTSVLLFHSFEAGIANAISSLKWRNNINIYEKLDISNIE